MCQCSRIRPPWRRQSLLSPRRSTTTWLLVVSCYATIIYAFQGRTFIHPSRQNRVHCLQCNSMLQHNNSPDEDRVDNTLNTPSSSPTTLCNSVATSTMRQQQKQQQLPLWEILSPPSTCRVEQMSSTDLAYIGDVVYELAIRSWMVWPLKRTSDLQMKVVELVREYQSTLLTRLRRSDFDLTSVDMQVLNRGRNAASGSNHRRSRRNINNDNDSNNSNYDRNRSKYQNATALEALIGYLYITDVHRCQELLRWIQAQLPS